MTWRYGGLLGLLLTAALTGSRCGAQDAARPTFLRVVDRDGEPVEDAEISVFGVWPEVVESLQDVDLRTVATDARGRAITKLWPDRCYAAWVRRAGDEGAGSSRLYGWFAAGAMFELVLHDAEAPASITIAGLDAWREHGPLQVVLLGPHPGLEQPVEPDVDGRFARPGTPFDRVEVRMPDGQPLWSASLADELVLPPPRRVAVRVLDGDDRPIAGAEVRHRTARLRGLDVDGLRTLREARERLCATTDDEGRCVVVVPSAGEPFVDVREDLLLLASAPGHASVAGGTWNGNRYLDDHRVDAFEGDELVLHCESVAPMRGLLPGAPRGTRVQLAAVCKLHVQRGYMHDVRTFTAVVGGGGRFALDGVPAELHSCRVTFVAPSGSAWRPPLFPPQSGRALPELLLADEPEALPLGLLRLEVLDARGGPARGGIAMLTSAESDGILLRDSLLRVPLDERGAATVPVTAGEWAVAAVTATGFGAETVEVEPGEHAARLELQPLARMRVELRDRRGEPVAGARLQARGRRMRGAEGPVAALLAGLSSSGFVPHERLVTDARGVVDVPFVPVEGLESRFVLSWHGGRSDEFSLVAGGEVVVREQNSEDGR